MPVLQPATLTFLKQLKKNNNRPWFNEHKDDFIAAKQNMEELVAVMLGEVSKFDEQVVGLTPPDTMFRIYRDVRFAKDRRPYKIGFGAVLARGGRKHKYAGYYLHVEPDNTFLAGGMWQPDSEKLDSLRKSISRDSLKMRKIITTPNFKKYFKKLSGAALKTAPRGYAKDHPDIDLLRHKSFMMMHSVPDKDVVVNSFPMYAAKVFKAMKPLNDYLNISMGMKV